MPPAMKSAGTVSGGTSTRTAPGNTTMAGKSTIVFIGELDISRLSRFMLTTGWRLMQKGEKDEKKNRELHGRNRNLDACNDGMLLRQCGMEGGAYVGHDQLRADRCGSQDDGHPGSIAG